MKFISIFFLTLTLLNGSSAAAETNSDSKQEIQNVTDYVNNLIQEGYDIVNNPKLSPQERVKKSTDFIKANLDLDWMAKSSLGRYRKTLSPTQLAQFTKAYNNYVVKSYSQLSNNYHGEKAVLRNVQPSNGGRFQVNTEIIKPDSPNPIKISYIINKHQGMEQGRKYPYYIGDIVAEGVSLLNSQQNEFSTIISQQGFDKLISTLQKKT